MKKNALKANGADPKKIFERLKKANDDFSRARPGALVTGIPIFDDSVPKARLYGRYLTHVCVWVQTLSFQIRDSMCGFRVYPLDSFGFVKHQSFKELSLTQPVISFVDAAGRAGR